MELQSSSSKTNVQGNTTKSKRFSKQKKMMKKKGLCGKDLFVCTSCSNGFVTSRVFKTHILHCFTFNKLLNPKSYACAHCPEAFKTPTSLTNHMGLHGTNRFTCSLCDYKHSPKSTIRRHMTVTHKVNKVQYTPKDQAKVNVDQDEFVVSSKSDIQLPKKYGKVNNPFNNQAKANVGKGKLAILPKIARHNSTDEDSVVLLNPVVEAATQTSFKPTEIGKVPIQHIFKIDLKCSECSYQTKVRSNLVRHLRLHLTHAVVPSTTPLNVYPCLETNKKVDIEIIKTPKKLNALKVAIQSEPNEDRATSKSGVTKFDISFTKQHMKKVHPQLKATVTLSAPQTLCSSTHNEVDLKKHEEKVHQHSTTTLKFERSRLLKNHNTRVPSSAEVLFSNIQSSFLPKISCSYCSFQFESRADFSKHHALCHSHLQLNFQSTPKTIPST